MVQVKIKIMPNAGSPGTNTATLTVFDEQGIWVMDEVIDSTQPDTIVDCDTLGRIELVGIGMQGVVDYDQSASVPPTVEEAKTAKSAHPQPPSTITPPPQSAAAHSSGKSESKKEK